ncbi:MAG: hypothetical protein CMJ86_04770 [Planctomycetes bacterium]|nr:hypothetical protein [Planctomycetota bacterium]
MSDSSQQSQDRSLFTLAQIQHLIRVEFHRAQRYGYPLSCLMVGVDRLNQLRDLYGYDSKEAVIEEVIEILKRETRASDFLGRLADDRLLVVVPHTSLEGAQRMVDRLLTAARQLEFESEGRKMDVSLSAGIGSTRGGDDVLFFDALLEAAENGLQVAQAAGGNRGETGVIGG